LQKLRCRKKHFAKLKKLPLLSKGRGPGGGSDRPKLFPASKYLWVNLSLRGTPLEQIFSNFNDLICIFRGRNHPG
jgi:hypothetical protein